jgi:AcrR family transcriptional regulator
MEGISQYASVSKVTLYKYFEDKQALYEYILKQNYLREYDEVVETIESNVPFTDKIKDVVKARISKYYDKNIPIYHGEITLSLQLQKFIKEYRKKMQNHRMDLYEQGREEKFICADVTDKTLETYFKIIQSGMVSILKDTSDLDDENLTELLNILFAGVLGCHN